MLSFRASLSSSQPDVITRVCLIGAAALPWYAVVSGLYGLYFYVLLLVPQVGLVLGGAFEPIASDDLIAVTLFAALPLGLLLLLAMPSGLVWAAFGHPPGGLAGGVTRCGCVASMALAALYGALLIVAYANGLMQDGVAGVWWSGLLHVVVLLCGLGSTWRAWRWLRRPALMTSPLESGNIAIDPDFTDNTV